MSGKRGIKLFHKTHCFRENLEDHTRGQTLNEQILLPVFYSFSHVE